MQFGLYGTNAHVTVGAPELAGARMEAALPLPAGAQDKQFEFGLEVLREADRTGFDIILFAERHLGPDLTTWVVAGAIGSQLPRIKSMVAVHPGLWHPAMIAKLAVTLDRVCKGGMAINIVGGQNEAEFQMFGGTAMLGSSERYARVTEFIDIIRGMWTHERFTLEGKFYQVYEAELRLKPRSAEPPEIYTAASSDRGRDMVAETGDWWFLSYPRTIQTTDELLRELEKSIADMRERVARTGRQVRFGFNPFIGFGADADKAFEATIQRMMAFEPSADSHKLSYSMRPAALAGCIGTPCEVRKQVARFRDMGIELLLFKMTHGVEDVRRIGEEIISVYGGGV